MTIPCEHVIDEGKLGENFILETNVVSTDKQGGAVALLAQNEDVGRKLDHTLCREGMHVERFRCLPESRELGIISHFDIVNLLLELVINEALNLLLI